MNAYLRDKFGDRLRSIGIEVQIPNTNGAYYLPDDAILRGKEIVGAFIGGNPNDNANSPTGRPLASNNAVYSAFLTIKEDNDNVLESHPLSDFLQTAEDRSYRILNQCNINPQRSLIQVTNTSLISAGESFYLTFIYVV